MVDLIESMSIPEYIMGVDPFARYNRIMIVRLKEPISIIECRPGFIESGGFYGHYKYIDEGGELHLWTLKIHHLMTQEFDSEKHHLIVKKVLDGAWDWFMFYIQSNKSVK